MAKQKKTKMSGMGLNISGDNYEVSGMNATVHGNYNIVNGMNATVRGNHNKVNGMNPDVRGDNNTVKGMNADVLGKNNKVSGMNATSNGRPVKRAQSSSGGSSSVMTFGGGGGSSISMSSIGSGSSISMSGGGSIGVMRFSGGCSTTACYAGGAPAGMLYLVGNDSVYKDGVKVVNLPPGRRSTAVSADTVIVDGKMLYPVATPTTTPSAPSAPSAPPKPFSMLTLEGTPTAASEDTKDEHLCIMCTENLKNVLLLPCRHLVFCLDCARDDNLADTCPTCRKKFTSAMTIFS